MITINGTPAYVSLDRGNLWAMIRATDEATFDAKAQEVGLLVAGPGGTLRPGFGVTLARLGPHVLTPGTYDDAGNEITPPVMDARFHANFWLSPQAVALNRWQGWAMTWTLTGTSGRANKSETAVALGGIELIDPDSVATPGNLLF